MISSFRALIEKDRKGKLKWYTNPFEYFDEHGSHLVRLIMTASDQAEEIPTKWGGTLRYTRRSIRKYAAGTSKDDLRVSCKAESLGPASLY